MKLCNTASVPSRIRPSAPEPQPYPLRPLALIRTLKRKPLECWAAAHFEQPIVSGGLPIGHALGMQEHEKENVQNVTTIEATVVWRTADGNSIPLSVQAVRNSPSLRLGITSE